MQRCTSSFVIARLLRVVGFIEHYVLILQAKFNNTTKMTIETKREIRFYVCLTMGFALAAGGFFSPPIGEIGNSIIITSGIFLSLGAMVVGVDLKGIIHEFRLLRDGDTKEAHNDKD